MPGEATIHDVEDRFHDDFGDEAVIGDMNGTNIHSAMRGHGAGKGAESIASTSGRKAKTALGVGHTVAGQVAGLGGKIGAANTVVGTLGVAGSLGAAGGALATATSIAAAAAPVAGPIGWALAAIASTMSAVSAVKTHLHIKNLEELLTRHGGGNAMASSREATLYVIVKKNKKRSRKGLGVIPVLGSTANSFYSIGRAIQKKALGTKGKHRASAAKTLWTNQLQGCPLAKAVCLELLGQKIFVAIQHEMDGDLVIREKMKSI